MLPGASACDRHLTEEEVQGLVTMLTRMKHLQRLNEKQFHQMMTKLMAQLEIPGDRALTIVRVVVTKNKG